jgi:hypothetical protein
MNAPLRITEALGKLGGAYLLYEGNELFVGDLRERADWHHVTP